MVYYRRGQCVEGNMVKVGILGVQCDNPNLGVSALAYAAVKIAREACSEDVELVLFSANSDSEIERMQAHLDLPETRIRAVPFRHKNPLSMARSFREMRSCDLLIDFTGGDSFSDIYGLKRLLRTLLHKEMAINSRTPLVLAPQTYGPLATGIVKPWFARIVNRAAEVFTRDELSARFLDALTERDVLIGTDVAVTLPWVPELHVLPPTGRRRVGLNISGLLWNGGYTGENQFNLAANYQEYCHALTTALLEAGDEVHLVPHVLARVGEPSTEDDVHASQVLQQMHPECLLAPRFASPVEAKSYISHLDAFVGSRMHATIASLTSGVPTVPAAYSRKFGGFFGSLGYDVLVDLTVSDTQSCVIQTIGYLSDVDAIRTKLPAAMEIAAKRSSIFSGVLSTRLGAANRATTQP